MVRLLLVITVLLSLALYATPACSMCDIHNTGDPRVETRAATNIMSVGTTLNGYLADMGDSSSVEVWFYWWTESESEGHETAKQTMTATGEFSALAFPLTIGNTCNFNAHAQGANGGKDAGDVLSFYVP